MPPLDETQYFCTFIGTDVLQDVKTNAQPEIITEIVSATDSVNETVAGSDYGVGAKNQRGD